MKELNLNNRPDVKRILAWSDMTFEAWYKATSEATMRLVTDYGLFANIPNLNYDSGEYNMEAITHVGDHREALQDGLRFLNAIKKHRDKMKQTKKEVPCTP